MSDLLRWLLIGWIAGGGFVAAVVGIGAMTTFAVLTPRSRRVLPRLVAFIALPIFILSAIPMPWWLYLAYSGATLVWSEMERRLSNARRLLAVPQIVLATSSFLLAGWFLVRQIPPRLPHVGKSPIVALRTTNDALRATEDSWPRILETLLDVPVEEHRLSLDSIRTAPNGFFAQRPGIIIVEIGPHDLLARTTAREMHDGLEQLLATLSRRKHSIIMLEVPLGPLENRYGEIQRDLAQQHDVALIPRWVLACAWIDTAAGPIGQKAAQRFIARRLHDVLRPVKQS
jgi:hypothetical protein